MTDLLILAKALRALHDWHTSSGGAGTDHPDYQPLCAKRYSQIAAERVSTAIREIPDDILALALETQKEALQKLIALNKTVEQAAFEYVRKVNQETTLLRRVLGI